MVKEFDKEFTYFDENPNDDPFTEYTMSASHCETCGAAGKTYWVGDKAWLCANCFKAAKQTPKPESLAKFACGLQLDDDDDK